MMPEKLFSALQGLWLRLKSILERLAGADRVDRTLDALRFYEIKSRLIRFSMVLPDGNRMVYRPYDKRIIREIYFEGGYKDVVLAPGDSVIDIGANIGSFTVMAARRVGPSGRVLSVEPDPENARLLALNVSNNGFAQVVCVQAAASDKPGVCALYRSGDPALHTMVPRYGRSVKVRVETIDTLARDRGFNAVDLVKIDVEGAELDVLKGGVKTFERAKQIVLETSPGTREAALTFIQGIGFDVKSITHGGGILYAVARGADLSGKSLLVR